MVKLALECIIGYVSIAERIKETRARRGWTQQQSAEYFGVSIPAYQNWENGVKPPGKSRLEVIAEWVGVPVEELGPLRAKPLAVVASEETQALRQRLLDSKEAEIESLRQEIKDIRTVADDACDGFWALREFVEPRLEFLAEEEPSSPLNESLVLNYQLLAGQLERQLVALSRRAHGIVDRSGEWRPHRNNASRLIGSRRNTPQSSESSDSKA